MKLPLRFSNRAFEKEFIRDYNRQALEAMRIGFWMAAFLFAVFGILDFFLMPLSYKKMWFIRFVIVIPFCSFAYLLSYLKPFERFMQFAVSASSVIMGLGIVAMMAVSNESEWGYKFYYAGMMLVVMGMCSILRLRFYYALVSSLIIIAGYEATAVMIQRITTGDIYSLNFIIFINNNFFFIGANVIGLFAAYYVEYYNRVRFVQEEEIKDKHRDISRLIAKMRTDLELARQIQSRLLPEICPYFPGVRVSSLYKPMEELGGDFFDFIRFEERNSVGIFISDVSGHGLPAALVTSMLKALSATSGSLKFSTSDFLNYLNTHLTGQIGENFITAIYAIYDAENRLLKFSRAGHPYPVLIRNGRIKHLKSGGGIIGIDSFMRFGDTSVHLEPGDKVLFYTDGLTEQVNSSKQLFEEPFFSKVLPALSQMTIEDIITISYRRLIDFTGSDKFDDDICVLGLEIL